MSEPTTAELVERVRQYVVSRSRTGDPNEPWDTLIDISQEPLAALTTLQSRCEELEQSLKQADEAYEAIRVHNGARMNRIDELQARVEELERLAALESAATREGRDRLISAEAEANELREQAREDYRKIKRAEAEVQRLRGVLEEIAKGESYDGADYSSLATAALSEEPR